MTATRTSAPKAEEGEIWEHKETGAYLTIFAIDGDRVNVAPISVFEAITPILQLRRWITIRTLRRNYAPATYPLKTTW